MEGDGQTGTILSDTFGFLRNGLLNGELSSNHGNGRGDYFPKERFLNSYQPNNIQDGWMHASWVYDGSTKYIYIYLDGELLGSRQWHQMTDRSEEFPDGALLVIGRSLESWSFRGLLDDIGIWRKPLSQAQIAALVQGINPVAISSNTSSSDWKNGTDSDSDSLPDAWEMQVFGDLDETAEADTDNDGLTNSKELDLGTDPNDSDTDNDGLLDGVETNTGTWVSNSDRGTNPKKSDTDDDGFSDSVETNTGRFVSSQDLGTSPLKYSEDPTGWVHLAWVYYGVNDKIKMYVDGKLDAEKNLRTLE